MTIDNEPTLIEPTVLEAMMRKLSEQDNRFAYNIMLGTLAEHGMTYDSESGRIVYVPVTPSEVASSEGPGEGYPVRRTSTVKYRVAYSQDDIERVLFEDAKRRAGAPGARRINVWLNTGHEVQTEAYVDLEDDDA